MAFAVRRFELHRDVDVTGVSGEGVVADGIEYFKSLDITWPDGLNTLLPSGWVRIVWRGQRPSTVLWPSAQMAMEVHGHGGHTRLVWLDDEPYEIEALTRPLSEALAAYEQAERGRRDPAPDQA